MVYFYNNHYLSSLALDVNNLGFLRGYSAFEYLRTYNKKPFCLDAHLFRFLFSIKELGLNCPYSFDDLKKITLEMICHEASDCGVKWYAFPTSSPDGLRHSGLCELFAFTTPLVPISDQFYQTGIDCKTIHAKRPLPEAKTTAYLDAVRHLSQDKSIQEIIYTDHDGFMLEASTSNLFFVKNNTLYTAASDVLWGITREVVLEIAKGTYDVVFQKMNTSQLCDVDEAFLTASNKEIIPIRTINGLALKSHKVTLDLLSKFKEFIYSGLDDSIIPSLYQKGAFT